MASAWEIIANRRSDNRYRISLQASVSIVESNTSESQWPSVLAHTTEISRDGMALIVPSNWIGRYDLNDDGHLLRIILAISASTSVTITARLIHCGQFMSSPTDQGYMLGVKIEQIAAIDCLLYDQLIRSLTSRG